MKYLVAFITAFIMLIPISTFEWITNWTISPYVIYMYFAFCYQTAIETYEDRVTKEYLKKQKEAQEKQ